MDDEIDERDEQTQHKKSEDEKQPLYKKINLKM